MGLHPGIGWLRLFGIQWRITDLPPYQKLVSLGYALPKEFCLFPPVILDYLVAPKELLEPVTTVQDHIDYDLR